MCLARHQKGLALQNTPTYQQTHLQYSIIFPWFPLKIRGNLAQNIPYTVKIITTQLSDRSLRPAVLLADFKQPKDRTAMVSSTPFPILYTNYSQPTKQKMLTKVVLIVLLLFSAEIIGASLSQVDSAYFNDSFYLSRTQCTMTVSQSEDGTVGFQGCQTQDRQSQEWPVCFQLCCSDTLLEKFPEPSQQAIRFCKTVANIKKKSFSRLETICVVALGVAAVTALVVWCLISRFKKLPMSSNCPEKAQNCQQECGEGAEVEWEHEQRPNYKKGEIVGWSVHAKEHQLMKTAEDSCSICLENGPSAQLHCGHQYHLSCIGDWLSRSQCCPCCRLQDVRGVKVYCQGCRWRYYLCTRSLVGSEGHVLPLKCQNCINKSVCSAVFSSDIIKSPDSLVETQKEGF